MLGLLIYAPKNAKNAKKMPLKIDFSPKAETGKGIPGKAGGW